MPFRLVGMALLLVAVAVTAWFGARSTSEPDQRCTGAAGAYAATWNSQMLPAPTMPARNLALLIASPA